MMQRAPQLWPSAIPTVAIGRNIVEADPGHLHVMGRLPIANADDSSLKVRLKDNLIADFESLRWRGVPNNSMH